MSSTNDHKASIPHGYQDMEEFSNYVDQCNKEVLSFIKTETQSGLILYDDDQVIEENEAGEPWFQIKFVKQIYISLLYQKMILADLQHQKVE